MLDTHKGKSVCNETNYKVQPLFQLAARSLCTSNRHIPPRLVSGERLCQPTLEPAEDPLSDRSSCMLDKVKKQPHSKRSLLHSSKSQEALLLDLIWYMNQLDIGPLWSGTDAVHLSGVHCTYCTQRESVGGDLILPIWSMEACYDNCIIQVPYIKVHVTWSLLNFRCLKLLVYVLANVLT